jgi:hypothetical protein
MDPLTIQHEGKEVKVVPLEAHEAAVAAARQPVAGLADDKGVLRENWWTAFPGLEAEKDTMSRFKSVEGLAKSYASARREMGQAHVPVPRDDWSDEQWADFHAKIGAVKAKDDIDFSLPKDAPPSLKLPDGAADEFAEQAKRVGLTKRQATDLFKWFIGSEVETLKAADQSIAEARANTKQILEQRFGDRAGDALGFAKAGVQHIAKLAGDDKLAEMLINDPTIGDNPAAITAFAVVGQMLSERGILKGDAAMFVGQAEEVQREIDDMEKNPNSQWYHRLRKRDPEAAKRRTQLYERRASLAGPGRK